MKLEITTQKLVTSHNLAVVFQSFILDTQYQATKIFFIFLSLPFLANSNFYTRNGINFAILNDTSTVITLARVSLY